MAPGVGVGVGIIDRITGSLPATVDAQAARDLLARMDSDYLALYRPEEIAEHLRLAAGVTPEQPVQVGVVGEAGGTYTVTVVGADYFAEFSIICGLLAGFGLDIQSGHVHTSARARAAPAGPGRRRPRRPPAAVPSTRIVDVFRVQVQPGGSFGADRQAELAEELGALVRLLAAGRVQDARDRLHRRLVAQLERTSRRTGPRRLPVHVRFQNAPGTPWTVLDVRSKDTPAFLYSFANALALRGIYVHKVRIESRGDEVRDRFQIATRDGRRVEGAKERRRLRLAVGLIKEFTRFLPGAPDPARALRYFDQLLDRMMEEHAPRSALRVFSRPEGLTLLAHLLGSSEFLWEDLLREQFGSLLPILEELDRRDLPPDRESIRRVLARRLAAASSREERRRVVNEFKDREMFFIDLKHLLDPRVGLVEFSRCLSDLADAVLAETLETCRADLVTLHGRPANGPAFAIFGLGKYGGREMGYGSDVELMFVYAGEGRTDGREGLTAGELCERLARDVVGFLDAKHEGFFHVDLRLRPHGKAGGYACPLEAFTRYYSPSGDAEPFERQALIKLRLVAGDALLGARVLAHRDAFVYGDAPWDLKTTVHLRERQMRELVPPGGTNVKYSPGGVIDVEYAVQYLQILHGGDRPQLRACSTLEALHRLLDAGLISAAEHQTLRDAYLFLRTLVDALRMVRGHAKDLLLPAVGSEEMEFLARRMGYRGSEWGAASTRLAGDIARHTSAARAFFARRFIEPAGTPAGRSG